MNPEPMEPNGLDLAYARWRARRDRQAAPPAAPTPTPQPTAPKADDDYARYTSAFPNLDPRD